jgi:hypothetical protein
LKQDEPILSEKENTHVQDLLKHFEKHATEMDFDTIFSQADLAARLKYPITVNTVEGGALAKSKASAKSTSKRKRKAVTLQISESQPKEIIQPEVPILLSDKSSSRANAGRLKLS